MDLARGQVLFDSERKLQILILGDTVGGLTLGALLQKHGFDPLVLRTSTDWTQSNLTTLWNTGVRMLQKIGIDLQPMEAMVTLKKLFVAAKSRGEQLKRVDADTHYPYPTVFSTTELANRVHKNFGDERVLEKDIVSLDEQQNSVTAQFEDGVTESFDLVVDARNRKLADLGVETDLDSRNTHLTQIELQTPIRDDWRETLIEGWINDVLVQQIPSPENRETAVLRMTREHASIPVDKVITQWGRQTGSKPINQSGQTTWSREIGYDWAVALGTAKDTSRWVNGRQVFLSSAAWGLPPASGFHIGVGIEDAWVLADEIIHASGSAATVGRRFARRRHNRLTNLRNRAIAASSTHSYPVEDTEPFETVTAFRSVSLGSFCASELTKLQELSAFGS